MKYSFYELLNIVYERKASDLHIAAFQPPRIRIDGVLKPLEADPLTPTESKELIYTILSSRQKKMFEEDMEIDFSFGMEKVGRFRGNVFLQRGAVSGAFRRIHSEILGFEELGIPYRVQQLCNLPKGLILVTGPTGSGKSTSLACMIEHINKLRDLHIVTIEDPIEYFFTSKKAHINQRELLSDTMSFKRALKSVLREDPDVVFVGEMRDHETVEATLRVAETGHLTFSTLHTNSSAESISRIVDIFPPENQQQARVMLSMTLEAILNQSLLPHISGDGLVLAMEIMIPNSAIRNLIRENKIHQINSTMQIGQKEFGMITMNQSLFKLYSSKKISYETAMSASKMPDDLLDIIERWKRN